MIYNLKKNLNNRSFQRQRRKAVIKKYLKKGKKKYLKKGKKVKKEKMERVVVKEMMRRRKLN